MLIGTKFIEKTLKPIKKKRDKELRALRMFRERKIASCYSRLHVIAQNQDAKEFNESRNSVLRKSLSNRTR